MGKFKVGDVVAYVGDAGHVKKGLEGVVVDRDNRNYLGVLVPVRFGDIYCDLMEYEIELVSSPAESMSDKKKILAHIGGTFDALGINPNESFYVVRKGRPRTDAHKCAYRLGLDMYMEKLQGCAWIPCEISFVDLLRGTYEILPRRTELEILHDDIIAECRGEYTLTSEGIVVEDEATLEATLQGNVGVQADMLFLAEKRKVITEIEYIQRKYPDRDWDRRNKHYYAVWDVESNSIKILFDCSCKSGNYYFSSKEDVQKMIDLVTEDRYIRYIAGRYCV